MVYTDYTIDINDNIVFLDFGARVPSNRQYTTTIAPGISGTLPNGDVAALTSEYEFWFTSLYCPLYTTIGRVKLQSGPVADTFTDDTIYRMIHKNSLDAIDLVNINYVNDTPLAYDYYGCDWQGAPFHVRRYVECKTAYDVLALAKLNVSTAGGSPGGKQTKSLGDMSITYGGSSSSAAGADDPHRAADLYECWRESLRMMRNMKVAVKAYYDSSKGYTHPVRETQHNRVVRSVSFNNCSPGGPWETHRPLNGHRW